ncbi:unnamed protein product [Cylicocyclus nassatus]|uniref:Peptidase A2 domain-containing protein n=1 Tax=Cylicocyclus nassatus TaxID=53992 RepID=A0AA36H8S6_CYLNA|nr:unnamed protein product [Cylicocyclus nassatus]
MGSPRPPKRSRAQSVSRAEAPSSAEECEFARQVKQTFSQVADDAFVIGREVKTLRDATASAITDAWKDAKAATVTEGYRHDRFKTIDAPVFLVEHNAILAEDSATWHNNAHPKFDVPREVNNVNILALIDTGAVITVTSSSTASLLGVFALFESDIPAALDMAGIPINLIGIAHLRFQIGSFTFNHPVYFTETPCVPESGGSYNIILSNDLLSRLPSWCISYNRRLFTVAGEQINILCSAPTPAPLVDSTVPVRVAETTVLPPQTETFFLVSRIPMPLRWF